MGLKDEEIELIERWIPFNDLKVQDHSLWIPKKCYFKRSGSRWQIVYKDTKYLYDTEDFYEDENECIAACIEHNDNELAIFTKKHGQVFQMLAGKLMEETYKNAAR